MSLNNTTKIVQNFLVYYPQTRCDDYLLWLHVISYAAMIQDNHTTYTHCVTLADFLKSAKYSKYPHFETVSRARRKLQRKYPELRATAETRAERDEYEKKYRIYARARV